MYGLAKEQCLIGIVADSFQYLSIEQCNRNERLRWLALICISRIGKTARRRWLGLRQICDLVMLLDKHHEVIDRKRLNGYLEELQLMTIVYKPLMLKEARSYFWKKISLNFRLMTKHHY